MAHMNQGFHFLSRKQAWEEGSQGPPESAGAQLPPVFAHRRPHGLRMAAPSELQAGGSRRGKAKGHLRSPLQRAFPKASASYFLLHLIG